MFPHISFMNQLLCCFPGWSWGVSSVWRWCLGGWRAGMRRGRRGHGPRSGVRRGARDRGRCRAVGGRISRRCAGPRPADSAGCTGPVVFGGGGNGTSRSILSLVSDVWLRRALGLRRVMGVTGKAVGRIY